MPDTNNNAKVNTNVDTLVNKILKDLDVIRMAIHKAISSSPLPPISKDNVLRKNIMILASIKDGRQDEKVIQGAVAYLTSLLKLIPKEKRDTNLTTLILNAVSYINDDELITLSEASTILRGNANDKNLRYVNYLMSSGELEAYTDPSVSNPTQNKKVWKKDVLELKDKK